MPDLTGTGAPVAEKNERIRRRKIEVKLLKLRAAALDCECDIEQMEISIASRQEQIAETLQMIKALEKELKI